MARGQEDHVIICGYGVVGGRIAEQLSENKIRFVVIEIDPAKAQALREAGYSVVCGDATSSAVLREAGLSNAKAIAAVTDNDAKNLFTVITARDIRKDIFIATRANDDFVREKLVEAGANHIVMPQATASKEIMKEISNLRGK
jgi:voltage-gated potassium channel